MHWPFHPLAFSWTAPFPGPWNSRFLGDDGPNRPASLVPPAQEQTPLREAGGTTGRQVARGSSGGPISALQLFDLIYREETLFNVIKSVTRNGRSILLTALLALILVYLFSIVGFLFLKDDFILEVDRLPSNHSRGLGAPLLGGRVGMRGLHKWLELGPGPGSAYPTRPPASVSPLGFWVGV